MSVLHKGTGMSGRRLHIRCRGAFSVSWPTFSFQRKAGPCALLASGRIVRCVGSTQRALLLAAANARRVSTPGSKTPVVARLGARHAGQLQSACGLHACVRTLMR